MKNPQDNATMERVNKLEYKMLVTKDFQNKVFNYI